MGFVQVTHLRLTNTRFCILYVMNHFEAHLMVPSRVLDFKFRIAIHLFGVFFLIQLRQNGEFVTFENDSFQQKEGKI